MSTTTCRIGLKGIDLKVASIRCDYCGKLIDAHMEITNIADMEFCASCTREVKSDVETYLKNMRVPEINDSVVAFMARAHRLLIAHNVEIVQREKAEKAEKEKAAQPTAGFSG